MATRRQFVVALGGTVAAVAARAAHAQQGAEAPGATMEGDGYVPVRRLPRPAAAKRLTPLERDAVERNLACPCPCTLDVFTCRTSMPCGFSPRLHADVVQLDEANLPGHPDEWQWAAAAINKVLKAVPKKSKAAVHLCFGNYGGQSIQKGTWAKLMDYLLSLIHI